MALQVGSPLLASDVEGKVNTYYPAFAADLYPSGTLVGAPIAHGAGVLAFSVAIVCPPNLSARPTSIGAFILNPTPVPISPFGGGPDIIEMFEFGPLLIPDYFAEITGPTIAEDGNAGVIQALSDALDAAQLAATGANARLRGAVCSLYWQDQIFPTPDNWFVVVRASGVFE